MLTTISELTFLYYCKESESIDMYHKASYTLDAKIPRRRFDALLAAVSQGRLPSEISITVGGMTYDWQPDGSGKKWDNKSSPELPVESISFYIPLIGGDPHDFLDDRTIDDSTAPTRAQFNALMEKINYVAKETVICLIIVIGLLAVLVWRGH
jgi:hypothetical protein